MINLTIADIYRGPIVKQYHDINNILRTYISQTLRGVKETSPLARHQEKYFRKKRICAAFTTAQNMDEYFFTEVKPFLFDGAVRNRALRFTLAKQSLAENYDSFCAALDVNRD